MIVREIEPSEIDAWEHYIENNPTIAWQSYYWSQVVNNHYDTDFMPMAAFDGDRICGVMPLYLVSALKGRKYLISVPYAVGGGIVADNSAAEKTLIDKAIELHDDLKTNRIVFKQYKHKLEGPLQTDDNYYNRELDLTIGIDNLYANLDTTNRINIENASHLDLELRYPYQNIDVFYRLLLKHHRHSGIPCVSRAWIRDLIEFKMYQIAALVYEGRIVAATLVKEHKKSISFPFTCIPDDSKRSNMLAYQLYWKLIRLFCQHGKEIFHSGRIPNNDMTNCYRLGWNGKKCGYYYQYYPDFGGKSEYATKRGRKRQLLSTIWKKLPLEITAILGPKITRYFP